MGQICTPGTQPNQAPGHPWVQASDVSPDVWDLYAAADPGECHPSTEGAVTHHPEMHIEHLDLVGRVGLEPTTQGL